MSEEKRSLLDSPTGEGPGPALAAVGLSHTMLGQFDWSEFLREVDRFNDVGCFLDPTAWQKAQSTVSWRDQQNIAIAAQNFVEVVEKVKARAERKQHES